MIKAFLKKITLSLMTITMLLSSASTLVSAEDKQYISDLILSYGDTDDEAKKWLTDNDYEVYDVNLNEGAEDNKYISLGKSKKRSVYLGYKTTTDASKAITDMKLMNMEGGYSTQDYQTLLDNQKSTIKEFISNFKDALSEYRENYNNTDESSPAHLRAVAAHDTLNMFYDDDTGMNMGDLLLNKIKEEYSDDAFENLSESEKKKHADMTTILMQGNSEIVSTIEQTLASACDTSDTLWLERYDSAKTYDDMLDDLIENKNMSSEEAEEYLDKKYEDTASTLAVMASGYSSWLSTYTDSGVTLESTDDEISSYLKGIDEQQQSMWFVGASESTILSLKKVSDDPALLDILTSKDYDLAGEDKTLLYPLASVLSKGQIACLSFLCCNQLIEMGFNMGDVNKSVVKVSEVEEEKSSTSVYSGTDRTLFTSNVALTSVAYQLQISNKDKDYTDNWVTGGTSTLTKVLALATAISTVSLIVSVAKTFKLANTSSTFNKAFNKASQRLKKSAEVLKADDAKTGIENLNSKTDYKNFFEDFDAQIEYEQAFANNAKQGDTAILQKYFLYADVALTFATIALSAVTIWSAYKDLNKYYNVDFTPIPGYMVDEKTVDDEETFTYYKAVKCNRSSNNKLKTKNSELLGDYGDLNGDVGKQWLALYTTKDKSAGNSITTNFTVQYNNTNIPEGCTALTMFDSGSVVNLTDEKSGYTYNDKKKGIYLFYEVDEHAFSTGSTFTYGIVALGAGAVVVGVVIFLRKKKKKAQA